MIRTTAPPLGTIVAIDPGITHCGYAVLTGVEQLAASGTWIPRRTLSVLDRHLWLLTKLQDLLTEWQPSVLVFEEFVWMVGDNGEYFVRGRPALERLIGGIEALALWPPHPVLMPLLPSQWGQQLVGSKAHTKADVARIVNLRLRTAYRGNFHDNHEADAVGIALVAQDTLRQRQYLTAHSGARQ